MNSSVRLVVRALYRYPVKSCGAEPVDALEFAQDGLVRGDREWIVVDEQANPVWLGSHPRLLRQPKEGWAGLGWAGPGWGTLYIRWP